jgi:Protein of unknown function (DUF2917)
MTMKGQAMKSMLMSDTHQSRVRSESAPKPWAWRLARHEATTLNASDEPRWLLVNSGSVWLTQVTAASAHQTPVDIWLAAGQSQRLPAGSTWVLEAWQPAELSLAVGGAQRPLPALRRGWRSLLSWRQAES